MRFILRGKAYDKTPEDVEYIMDGIIPEAIRNYHIIVKGVKFPPKQVLGELLRLGKVEFTTMDAANILRRLDFKLERLR